MGFSFSLALRYMRSRKRESISVGTLLATCGVALGTMALVTVLSVTGGFRSQFRDKVLGVNAHVLVLKYASEFREYRDVMAKVEKDPDVIGASPFVINPMMVTHDQRTATGVLLKGVDPERMLNVLDLPKHMIDGLPTKEGALRELRRPGAKPPERKTNPVGHIIGDPDDPLQDDPSGEPSLPKIHEPDTKEPDTKELDTGEPGDDDDFLEQLQKSVVESEAAKSEPPTPEQQATPLDDGSDFEVPEGAPIGKIEPEGGFAGELPDVDVTAGIVSDPCSEGNTNSLPGIVIGVTLQKTLAVSLGDCIQVTSPTIGYSYSNGQLRPPVAKQFRVQGIFSAGFDQYDSKLMYTDLYEAQTFYGAGDTVTGVEMRVKNIEDSHAVTERIDKLLNNGIYHTMDWEELNHGLFTALRIQQILMSLVLALIILVAAFTVIATLIMIVFDKKREIAAMKAMGASDGSLLRAFLYQGLLIGVAGTSAGLVAGFVLCKWALAYGFPLDPKVYFISQLPVVMRPWDFVFTGIFAVLVCLAACVWPALHAARLRPAEAFREQQ